MWRALHLRSGFTSSARPEVYARFGLFLGIVTLGRDGPAGVVGKTLALFATGCMVVAGGVDPAGCWSDGAAAASSVGGMAQTLSLHEANQAVPGWRALASGLHLTVATDDFATALTLVDRIGAIAEEQQHHPNLDLRWGRVHVVTTSHDAGGVTDRDVRLATAVNEILGELGLTPETSRVAEFEMAIDALDIPSVRPFWAAVLGYEEGRGHDLVDPDGVRPPVWFQQMDEPRPQRNRIHVDVWVAPEEAEPRIARAIEAGGRLLSEAEAPSFWVLADLEGNEACICTAQERG